MLVEKNAHEFWPLDVNGKNRTIYDIQHDYIRNFCVDLINTYEDLYLTNERAEENQCHYDLSCPENLNIMNFRSKIKNIRFNSKDIIFNERIPLEDWFKDFYQRRKDIMEDKPSAFSNEDVLVRGNIPYLAQGNLYELKNYLNFFGEGYFAWMDFYVIRIGSQQYSFYSLER